jgi:cytochrome c-type biogenesis protein CcmH/NrfF
MRVLTIMLVIWLAPTALLFVAALWIMMRRPPSDTASPALQQEAIKEVAHPSEDREVV